jgi:hypothetical protein
MTGTRRAGGQEQGSARERWQERLRAADERDRVADERDVAGDRRDRAADERDAVADERDHRSTQRDAEVDRVLQRAMDRDVAADRRDIAARGRTEPRMTGTARPALCPWRTRLRIVPMRRSTGTGPAGIETPAQGTAPILWTRATAPLPVVRRHESNARKRRWTGCSRSPTVLKQRRTANKQLMIAMRRTGTTDQFPRPRARDASPCSATVVGGFSSRPGRARRGGCVPRAWRGRGDSVAHSPERAGGHLR